MSVSHKPHASKTGRITVKKIVVRWALGLLIYTCNSGVRPVYTNNNVEPLPLYRIGGILNLSKAVRYETQASHGLRLLGMKLRH